jgi:hypothetical protein
VSPRHCGERGLWDAEWLSYPYAPNSYARIRSRGLPRSAEISLILEPAVSTQHGALGARVRRSVSGGGRGYHFGGPVGTTPPLVSGGDWRPSRNELTSRETMAGGVGSQSHEINNSIAKIGCPPPLVSQAFSLSASGGGARRRSRSPAPDCPPRSLESKGLPLYRASFRVECQDDYAHCFSRFGSSWRHYEMIGDQG